MSTFLHIDHIPSRGEKASPGGRSTIDEKSTAEAKRICAGCDVREQCLEWALENQERFGIFGGKSERERRRILAERKGDAA